MQPILITLALKIVTLIGATAQTAGFIGLFAIEALQPYKWQLLIGGTLLVILSEGISYLLAKRWTRDAANEETRDAA
jgi:hypothetical protein